jgi:hypothetical protein
VDGRTKPRKEVLIVMIATRYLRNIGGIVGDDRNCASLVAEKQPKREAGYSPVGHVNSPVRLFAGNGLLGFIYDL